MKTRIITALVALCVFIPVLYFSDTIAFLIFVQLVSLLAAYEVLVCTNMMKNKGVSIASIFCAAMIPFFTRELDFKNFFVLVLAVFFVLLFFILSASVFARGRYNVADAALSFSMIFFVTVSLSNIILLRDLENGKYIYLLAFFSAWISDTGAYFSGFLFGKRKLIPEVSPKKTVEGAIGGFIICVLSFVLYGFVVGKIFDITPNYIALAVSGAVLSLVSMMGDLIFSLVKRHYNIKDYGWLLPGHGGVLDRFDSVIATAPFLFLLCNALPNFNLFN